VVAPGQPKQKCSPDPISMGKNLGVVALVWHPSYNRKHKKGRCCPGQSGGEKNVRPCLQNDKRKRAGEVTEEVERLPCKCEAQSSNPSTTFPQDS
jgi:hypothetical protein